MSEAEAGRTMDKRAMRDAMVDFLNSLTSWEPGALWNLLQQRVPCGPQWHYHPSVGVLDEGEKGFSLGVLGILNGFFGDDYEVSGAECIMAVRDDDTGNLSFRVARRGPRANVMAIPVLEPHFPGSPPGSYRFEGEPPPAGRKWGISCNCPCGCGTPHYLPFRGTEYDTGGPSWEWDGNLEAPTLSPSVQMTAPCRWHGYLRAGVWVSA